MKKIKKRIFLLPIVLVLFVYSVFVNKTITNNSNLYSASATERQEFLERIIPLAQEESKKTGVYASVIIAQAIQESGWGTSKLSSVYNAYFGVSDGLCSKSGDRRQVENSNQFWSGAEVCLCSERRCAWRRAYDSLENSVHDHSRNLWCQSSGTYIKAGVFESSSALQQLMGIQNGGYATGNYYNEISQHIQKYNLQQYDTEYQKVKPDYAESCTDYKYEGEMPEFDPDEKEDDGLDVPNSVEDIKPPTPELGTTTYTGDIEKGYIHENHKGYSLIFGKSATKEDKKKEISDVVKIIYNHAAVEAVTPSSGKIGSAAYHADVTYTNGLFDGKIVYYNQGDYQNYAYGSYGNIASHGCGPTSMSIVLSSFGKNVNPIESTNWACSNGYCSDDGSYHSLICAEANHYGLNCEGGAEGLSPYVHENQADLVNKLSSGKYMAVVLAGPGHFTNGGHFFVLGGIDDNKVRVYDPGNRATTDKNYSLDSLIDPGYGHVKNIWLISK